MRIKDYILSQIEANSKSALWIEDPWPIVIIENTDYKQEYGQDTTYALWSEEGSVRGH